MSVRYAEETWVRCDREAFELEPTLERFVRLPYAGELEAVGMSEHHRSEFVICVTAITEGVRGRKFIHVSDLAEALKNYPGIPMPKESTNGF